VYGIRADCSTDSILNHGIASCFYRLLALLGLESVHNHADFRLMSRRVIEALREYREVRSVSARNCAANWLPNDWPLSPQPKRAMDPAALQHEL
jgi:hypothetical protein